MSERTGLGMVEVCILEALDAVGGRPDRDHVLSAKVLKFVEDKMVPVPVPGSTTSLMLWAWTSTRSARSRWRLGSAPRPSAPWLRCSL